MSDVRLVNDGCVNFVRPALVAAFFIMFVASFAQAATPVCGNGVSEAPEQCDDGGTISGDGCSSTCMIEAVCGNRIAEPGEDCDQGNVTTVGCSATCQFVPGALCGNGAVGPGEFCDPALTPTNCNGDCTFSICGDGKIGPGEQCDGRAAVKNCNANCRFSNCMDGILNTRSGEECDPGMVTGSCNPNCKISRCGDNITNTLAGEQCDPPGTMPNGDTCTSNCQITLASLTTAPGAGDPLFSTATIIGIVVGVVSLIALVPIGIKFVRWSNRHGYCCGKGAQTAAAAAQKPNPMFNAGAAGGPAASTPTVSATPSLPASAVPSAPASVTPSTASSTTASATPSATTPATKV